MTRPRKILIADDAEMAREMLRVMLDAEGYEIIFAKDGQQAVEMAASEKPDLVITDALMPKLHGFLVCKAIKELDDAPSVILLTGVYTKPTYKWEVKKEYGADDLLIKPVKHHELVECVKKHLPTLPPLEDRTGFAILADAIEINDVIVLPAPPVLAPAASLGNERIPDLDSTRPNLRLARSSAASEVSDLLDLFRPNSHFSPCYAQKFLSSVRY